jgi:DNA polymerase-3 subunit alpha
MKLRCKKRFSFIEDFYLELQRHNMPDTALQEDMMAKESWLIQYYLDTLQKQEKVNETLIQLGKKHGIKTVATQNSHYLERKDWKAHEVLLNIQSGEPIEIAETDSFGAIKQRVPNPKRRVFPSHMHHFRSQEEMIALFHDVPEAIQTTCEIADKCALELDFKTKHYPVFTPPGQEPITAEAYLRRLAEAGIEKRYTPEKLQKVAELYPGKAPLDVVKDRLDYELSIICPKGMSDYLLIVWDFIHWAKTNGIPMGPGRGSGAGSIVLYLIGITDIEPLRFHLFFERFINPERLSYPDIDVDICMDRRPEVIEYTLKKYGKANVAQIITFGTMKAKMVIRDVGRVLDVPLSKVNQIAKLVPEELNITLESALEKDADLRAMVDSDEDARRIVEMGKVLEGSIRSTGIHAAGIIIAGEPLTEYIPVALAKDSDMPVTQYSMKPVELVGMLKVDFLGLKTLTAIDVACKRIYASRGVSIDWVNLELTDKKTFDLLNQGKTLGVFQLESGGMQDLACKLHLDRFEEIIAVGALYRPGPMDMIPSFINRKHGLEPIEYDHPWMKEILSETYGIMVYQEQVMQIAQRLANYSLGEGDVLRRAMGKKDASEMARQREKFKAGALQNGISETKATEIFDKMEKFASYGFNKSHAAAYGYLSYVTAFLKANYPAEWLAALMTCDSHDLTKVAKFIREAKAMGIETLPPDLNEAGSQFAATPSGIRFAMGGIKGIGDGVVEAILEERKKGGRFKGLWDFVRRIDHRRVGKKGCESLIEAGALDFTGWSRDQLLLSLPAAWDRAEQEQKDKTRGFITFFSLMDEGEKDPFSQPPKVLNPTPPEKRLLKEKELLGFFLTGHPMDRFQPLIQRLSCMNFLQIEELPHDAVFRAAFMVETVATKIASKTQRKFAILTISDGYLTFELPLWSDLYEEKSHLVRENQLFFAVLQVDRKSDVLQLRCRWFDDLREADEAMVQASDQAFDKAKQQLQWQRKEGVKKESKPEPEKKKEVALFELKLDMDKIRHSHILSLKEIFEAHRGECPVHLHFCRGQDKVAKIEIDAAWGVKPSPALMQLLNKLPTC